MQHIQTEIQTELMLSGVTIESPPQTSIDYGVAIGKDTVVRPGTVIDGDVTVGSNCVIGPNVHIQGPKTIADGQQVH